MLKKLEYIWDYYKLQIFAVIILLVVLVSFIQIRVNKKNPILYIGFINTDFKDSIMTQFGDSFVDSIDGSAKDCCRFYTNLILTEKTDSNSSQYVYASEMKLLAAIESKELDLVIVNEEVLETLTKKDYLYDLSAIFPDTFASKTYSIDISNISFLSDAGINDSVYLCVISNSPRIEMVKKYINYLIASS